MLVGFGVSKGPTTKDGFTTTRSIPCSFAMRQASFSAKVFANAYQSCQNTQMEKVQKKQKQQKASRFWSIELYRSASALETDME